MAVSCIKHSFDLDASMVSSGTIPSLYDLPSCSHKGDDIPNTKEPPQSTPPQPVSAEARGQAEAFKNTGNSHLAAKRAAEAAEAYTHAIELDPENFVYFSNRAAAFTMQGEYEAALEDCRAAVSLNPEYAKGYGRMGAAYMGLGNPIAAIEAYEKAVKLDPDNVGYQSAKRISAQKKKEQEKEASPAPAGPPSGSPASPFAGLGGMDIGALLNNPELIRMASQMMGSPDAMRSMMNSPQLAAMMQSLMGNRSSGGAASPAEDEDKQ